MQPEQLAPLIRANVETRGNYGPLSDADIARIAPKIDGVLMGDVCVWWKASVNERRAGYHAYHGKLVYIGVLLYHNIVEDLTENYGLRKGHKCLVRHKCKSEGGRSLCINPAHMELGSALENASDSISRDKTRKRTLTDEQVIEIRERYAAGGIKQRELGQEYGVSRICISQICTGFFYADVGGPVQMRKVTPYKNSDSTYDKAIEMFESGSTQAEVQEETGLDYNQAMYIRQKLRRVRRLSQPDDPSQRGQQTLDQMFAQNNNDE